MNPASNQIQFLSSRIYRLERARRGLPSGRWWACRSQRGGEVLEAAPGRHSGKSAASVDESVEESGGLGLAPALLLSG